MASEMPESRDSAYGLQWPGKDAAAVAATTPCHEKLAVPRTRRHQTPHADNLLIVGNNLDALKLLQDARAGQIHFILIDPPYNTTKHQTYADDFRTAAAEPGAANASDRARHLHASKSRHAAWLSMMYPRLILARQLLTADGAIAVHIDEHELANLILLLDEVFGESNRLGQIVWNKCHPKGDARGIAYQHETILAYARDRARFLDSRQLKRLKPNAHRILAKARSLHAQLGPSPRPADLARLSTEFTQWLHSQPDLTPGERAYNQIDDHGDVFQAVSMAWPNKRRPGPEYFQPLIHPRTGRPCPVPRRGWRNPPATMRRLLAEDQIIFGPNERKQPRRKYLLRDNLFENVPSVLTNAEADDALLARLDVPFHSPKPFRFTAELIDMFTRPGETVLDFFAGSGTTGHAAMHLAATGRGPRRWIMAEHEAPLHGAPERNGHPQSTAAACKKRLQAVANELRSKSNAAAAPAFDFQVCRIERPAQRPRPAHADNLADESAAQTLQLTWPGKESARALAYQPAAARLRSWPRRSVRPNKSPNLIITGDNLPVLKLLQSDCAGQVDMIYIDPPYNTGNPHVYEDDFRLPSAVRRRFAEAQNAAAETTRRHTAWLNMMLPRLILARNLLRPTGTIFISIDDREVHNLRHLLDEVFGPTNFLANIIWQSRTSISNDLPVSPNHNHTIVYARDATQANFHGEPLATADYTNPDDDPRGPWKLVPLDANKPGGDTRYPIRNPATNQEHWPPGNRIWSVNRDTCQSLLDSGQIVFGRNGRSAPKRKLYLRDRLARGDTKTPSSLLLDAGTTRTGTDELMALFDGQKVFTYPKPVSLLQRLMNYALPPNGLVLDFFAGSGTTGHAAFALNQSDGGQRRFILVQAPTPLPPLAPARNFNCETIADLCAERVSRALKTLSQAAPSTRTAAQSLSFKALRCVEARSTRTTRKQKAAP